MISETKKLLSATFLALSLASCGFGNSAQGISEDVIEFRQVLGLGSAQSTLNAFGQEFKDVDCRNPPTNFEPPIELIGCSSDQNLIYLLGASELDGNAIERVRPSIDTTAGDQWILEIGFDDIGTKKFAEMTKRVTSLPSPTNQIAITAGNLVITAPSINEAITAGLAQITGSFTEQEMFDLADAIRNRRQVPPFLRW
jgi:preprotein translocase subunit SecD